MRLTEGPSTADETAVDPTGARVLGAVAALGSPTLADLRDATGLSRQTLTGVVARLRDDGWLEPAGTEDGGAGRPARRWGVTTRARLVAAVDVGPRAVRVALAGPLGDVLAETRTPVPEAGGDPWSTTVVDAVRDACAGLGLAPSELGAVGIGVPGIVEPGGRVLRSDIVPAWTGTDLATALGSALGAPVVAANDVNLAALGEHRAGAASTGGDLVHVHVGRRCSTALVVAGRLHEGRHGAAGEIGSNPSLYFHPVLELLGPDADPDDDRFLPTLRAAADGDPIAVDGVRRLAAAVARLVRVLGSFVDPDLVVVSGPAALAGDALLAAVRDAVDFPDDIAPDVVLGALAERATLVGAVGLALERAARDDPRLAAVVASSPRPDDEPDRAAPAARPSSASA